MNKKKPNAQKLNPITNKWEDIWIPLKKTRTYEDITKEYWNEKKERKKRLVE